MKTIIHSEKEWREHLKKDEGWYCYRYGGEPEYFPCMISPVYDNDSIVYVFFYPLEARKLMMITEEMTKERNNVETTKD